MRDDLKVSHMSMTSIWHDEGIRLKLSQGVYTIASCIFAVEEDVEELLRC